MNKKSKSNVWLYGLLLLILISIGYAALTANLTIQGTTKLGGNTWNVQLENIHDEVLHGATLDSATAINGDTLTFSVTLAKPGDYYEFKVDVTNNGGIDAKIGTAPVINGFTPEQLELASYSIKYSDNSDIALNDELPINQTKTIVVRVEFRDDIANDDLPTTLTTLNTLSLTLNYVQNT